MCGRLRLDRKLTGTALVLILSAGVGVGSVFASQDVNTPVPVSESARSSPRVPDPAAVAPTTSEGVPIPEAADVPPPTIRDIGAVAPATVNAADLPIVEKLRELVGGRQIERIVDRKHEREAVVAFYAARGFAPLWIENGAANRRAMAAIAHVKAAAADGLDPADYAAPEFKAGADATVLAESEIRLTAVVLTYARHAQAGRVHFSRISSEISYNLIAPEPAEILAKMAVADGVGEALAGYNPPHAGYKALRAKLAEMRRPKGDVGAAPIANGPLLKVGMQDERVPLLRARLGIPGGADDRTYDKAVAGAVKELQRQRKLPATGSLTPATIDALNGAHRGREADIIIANMERWRWMPRELGKTYSMLNIPDFSMQVVRDGATVWKTKVVVGKLATPTPILSDTMKFITVNPTWNVPPSLMNREYLPALQQDPTVLDRMGLKVVRNSDGTVRLYQPPGERNALGRLRFNFPNKYTVYQHDTPDKYLFDKSVRAYSNGCMRVQDPVKYAEVLLSVAQPKEGYTQERLRKMFGGAERNISFPEPIPVHLTYQTAFVDGSGALVLRDDIYGYDERIQVALKGDNRRIADIAVPSVHKHGDDRGPRLTLRGHEAPVTSRAPSFIERLFR